MQKKKRLIVPCKKYEVYHPEGIGQTPKFATWNEAIAKQVEWNRNFPGHRARKVLK